MLLDDEEEFDQELRLALDAIDEEVDDFDDGDRDNLLIERDSAVLKNIRKTISSKHESYKFSE